MDGGTAAWTMAEGGQSAKRKEKEEEDEDTCRSVWYSQVSAGRYSPPAHLHPTVGCAGIHGTEWDGSGK